MIGAWYSLERHDASRSIHGALAIKVHESSFTGAQLPHHLFERRARNIFIIIIQRPRQVQRQSSNVHLFHTNDHVIQRFGTGRRSMSTLFRTLYATPPSRSTAFRTPSRMTRYRASALSLLSGIGVGDLGRLVDGHFCDR